MFFYLIQANLRRVQGTGQTIGLEVDRFKCLVHYILATIERHHIVFFFVGLQIVSVLVHLPALVVNRQGELVVGCPRVVEPDSCVMGEIFIRE